jgi:hypothetical protein
LQRRSDHRLQEGGAPAFCPAGPAFRFRFYSLGDVTTYSLVDQKIPRAGS